MNFDNVGETVVIDDVLAARIRARVGASLDSSVRVSAKKWDLGFCDTCSYPKEGFAVYVNDELVYPNDETLSAFGGYVYADSDGFVAGNKLTTWGHFFDWLDSADLEEVSAQEDMEGFADSENRINVKNNNENYGEGLWVEL